MNKKLHRSKKSKMICGVCGGLAEYFEVDPTIVRLICAAICIAGGSGVLLYIVAALIIPEDDDIIDV